MDIKCIVCGEPWDAYGVSNGDMAKWEAELFRKGAGCPCCKGVMPEKPFEPQSIFDLENGDDDEFDRLVAWENVSKRPEWKPPEPKILWTCEGCGVQVVESIENGELEYHLPPGAKGAKWYHSHPYYKGEPGKAPAHVFGGSPVCEFCLDHCHHCGEPVCSTLEYGDTWDAGNCVPYETWYVICMDCATSQCEHCGGWSDDESCDCCTECGECADFCSCHDNDESETE